MEIRPKCVELGSKCGKVPRACPWGFHSKKGLLDDEIRVLKKAVWVFENVVYKERGDMSQKLDKFKKRLEKANKKRL